MSALPPALVARIAQAHGDASSLMLELHRIRVDAHAAGADDATLGRLDALQLAADTAWRFARREHARHDPVEAAAQEEGRLAELHADEVAAQTVELDHVRVAAREALVRELASANGDEAHSRDMVRRIESGEPVFALAAHGARALKLAALLRPQEPPHGR